MRTPVGAGQPGYLGVISVAGYSHAFSREEEELLDYLAGRAAISIEHASLHETVERQAVTDELTGLANSRAFHSILERQIERARRFQSPPGLVMVDLDDFERVNDEFGHQQGDEVLASVAGVLREFSRDIDAPARYGGEDWRWYCLRPMRKVPRCSLTACARRSRRYGSSGWAPAAP
jgi:GGDEF domain-containing protein